MENLKTIVDRESVYEAVNWNIPDDAYTQDFFDQNVDQFWLDKDLSISDDLSSWEKLSPAEKKAFSKVLGGLTGLDTKQANTGMPVLSLITEGEQRKAVINFMGAMEAIHAKFYSSVFMTLMSSEEIRDVFKWTNKQSNLQVKTEIIDKLYKKALVGHALDRLTLKEKYLAYVASVFLESFLFYSGFFYPLYLAGRGLMRISGEGIGLILRDESIHGMLVGMYAQEVFSLMSKEEQEEVLLEVHSILDSLYENELIYTKEVYEEIGLVDEVTKFLQYNADKALMNLGLPVKFGVLEEEIDPVVLNGIDTITVNHDFFSVKGNSYIFSITVEKIEDRHIHFNIVNEFGDIDPDNC